jgi:hypothetical protein
VTELSQLIDHAAELRRDIDRLELEVEVLVLSLLGVMLAVGLIAWQQWLSDR